VELLLNSDEITIQDKLIDMIEINNSINILSPYVTKNKALDCILGKADFKLKLVIDFDPESLLKGSTSLDVNQIKKLIENGQKVFYNPELHSKLFITEDSVILGSANFTRNGLSKRKESAILFNRKFNQNIYRDCKNYFEDVLKSSIKITENLLTKTIAILKEKEYSKNERLEKLEKLLSKDYIKRSLYDDYDLKYEYPKSINELQKGLKFDLIEHEKVEKLYKNMSLDKGKRKAERVAFVKDNLYEKNKGYSIKSRFEKTSTLWKFYRDNQREFDKPLKSYKNFIIDRSMELLELYRISYNIQPVTGFFAKKFDYLKEKGKIDENFFHIKLSDFEEQWRLNLLKGKLDEIDEFFDEYDKLPNSYARRNIYIKRKYGTLSPEKETRLRYEGYLSDNLYHIKKKYKNGFYSQESMKLIIEQYFRKWSYSLDL
jgi:hypothetical protein